MPSDGISQPGEVKTLDALGIKSIGLEPDGPWQSFSDGSSIQGLSSFTRVDGSTGIAGDVALAFQSEPAGAGADIFRQAFQFASAMSSFGIGHGAASFSQQEPGLADPPSPYQTLAHEQVGSAGGFPR